MVCRFCGVETRGHAQHETQEACIEALRAEIAALRDVLRFTGRPDESPVALVDRTESPAPPRK